MSAPPLLLVVTPTLGRSVYLDQTMASVAALHLSVAHVLATPASQVGRLQGGYPHALVVPDGGHDAGVYGALNSGLRQAPPGWEWFTYLNDDDVFLDGFSDVVRLHLARPEPEPVVYGDVALVDDHGRHLGLTTVERDPRWIPALLQQGISPLMQQGMLFRRDWVERLGGFDVRYRLCADLDFWLRAHAAGASFRYCHQRVARFRVHAGQLSGDTALTRREQADIVGRHYPARLPAGRRHAAVLRYRLCNLLRYLGRTRSLGFRTSYQVLHPQSRA